MIEIWLTTNLTQPTPKRLSVLESLKTLRDELAKFDFKDTLDGIIKSIGKEEDSETFKILEAFVENLKIVHELGALDATREILTAIFRFLEIKKHEEGRNRTSVATKARKEKPLPNLTEEQKNGFWSKVSSFFQEVEDEWHPKVERKCSARR